MLTRLAHAAVARPVRTLLLAAAVVAAVSPGTLRLKLRTDGRALVAPHSPAVREDHAVRAQFGFDDLVAVVIRSQHPDGIFNPQTLRTIRTLTERLVALPGVGPDRVTSLATEVADRFQPGSLRLRRLLDPLPTTPAQCRTLRDDLAAFRVFTGTLLAFDARAAAVLVGVPYGHERSSTYAAIRDAVDSHDPAPDLVKIVGAPVAEMLLGIHILEDLGVPGFVLRALGVSGSIGRTTADAGSGASAYFLRVLIANRFGIFPLTAALMCAVLLFAFRRLAAVAVPLLKVGACLLVTLALMGWAGVPIYLTIAVLPVLIVSSGVTDEIHILSRVRSLLNHSDAACEPAVPRAVERAMLELRRAVFGTSLTTALGFASFALSPLEPVRAFGLVAAFAAMLCWLWTRLVTPAALVLFPRTWLAGRPGRRSASSPASAGAAHARLALLSRFLLAAVALAILAAPDGVRRLSVQDSWIGGFDPNSAFRRATERFNRDFCGAHVLNVCFDTAHDTLRGEIRAGEIVHGVAPLPVRISRNPQDLEGCQIDFQAPDTPDARQRAAFLGPGPPTWRGWISAADQQGDRLVVRVPPEAGDPVFMLASRPDDVLRFTLHVRRLETPAGLRRLRDFERYVASLDDFTVGGVLGPARLLETVNFMIQRRHEPARDIPANPNQVRMLWRNFAAMRGESRRRQVLDDTGSAGLVSIFLQSANFADTARLLGAIRDYEQRELAPHGISLRFAGDVAVSQSLIQDIVTTQVRSLALSLVGVVLAGAWLGRSLRWGIFSAVPCAVAVLLNFAAMGWLGVPLGVATSMFAGMVLGIGVDYAVHLMERFRIARAAGASPSDAVADALRVAAPAIRVDVATVALAFAALTLSQVPPNQRLGSVALVCILAAAGATLLVLPFLLRHWPPPLRSREVA